MVGVTYTLGSGPCLPADGPRRQLDGGDKLERKGAPKGPWNSPELGEDGTNESLVLLREVS